ncbi:hypothetical protein MNV49_003677 [Pseudohyphozyma bogoriensis]|nr:hypothetical protein MNV49_003677 [Pseudohyphozyma bogoriensis]
MDVLPLRPGDDLDPKPLLAFAAAQAHDGPGDNSEVEDLLYGAQMDFISHRNSEAVDKLRQAVALNSSAACSKASASSPPVVVGSLNSRRLYMPVNPHSDGLEAASLFVAGLEIELRKQFRPTASSIIPVPNPATIRRSGSARSIDSDESEYGEHGSDSGTESDDDGAEGRYFQFQRALDLVIGLVDLYRYGILQHDIAESVTLWKQGADIAQRTLRYIELLDATSPLMSPTSPALPDSPPDSLRNMKYDTKLIDTIRVYLLYLVALQTWPTDKAQAESCWRQIVRVASASGGMVGVGTKEGDEIVAKAKQRLSTLDGTEPDVAWKQVKKRKDSIGSGTWSGTTAVESAMKTKFGNGMSGDALVNMWRERKLARAGSVEVLEAGKTSPTTTPDSSTISIRPVSIRTLSTSNLASLASTVIAALPKAIPSATKFHFATSYPSPPSSPSSSPPQTPSEEVPAPVLYTTNLDEVDESSNDEHVVVAPPPFAPRLTRKPSTASFNPPALPRLLRRVQSNASITTVPSNFFSAQHPTTGATWRAQSQPITASALSSTCISADLPDRAPPAPASSRSWSSTFKARFSALRTTSTRIVSDFQQLRQASKKPSAVSALHQVLIKDDRSAGPGMYWGFEDEELVEELAESEVAVPEPPAPSSSNTAPGRAAATNDFIKPSRSANSSPPRSRPPLRATRSFVDPTSAPVSAIALRKSTPLVITTPPTPERPDPSRLMIPTPAPRIKKKRAGRAKSPARECRGEPVDVGIDPFLLELERNSRCLPEVLEGLLLEGV